MPCPGAVVAGWIRVSTAHQRDDSESPANQRQQLEAAGCQRFYQDLAVSGFLLEQRRRRARDFERLCADIAAGQIREVVAVRSSRLIRRDHLLIQFAELCQQHGVTLRFLQGGVVDVRTASGWLKTKIIGAFDEHYSRALSEAIRSGFDALHARGIPARSARALPFHLERTPGTRHGVQPSPHWPHARHAVERYLAGEWSTCQAAAHLYQTCGWRSTSSEFVKWCKRPAIAGHMAARVKGQEDRIILHDCWPALVSSEEWALLRARIAAGRRQRPASPTHPRLLSGVCCCALCGGKLAYVSTTNPRGARYWFLRCRRQGCITTTISAPPIWEAILDHLDARTEALVVRRAADAGVRQEPPEVITWRRELAAREALPPEMQQDADRLRIQELQGLIAAAAAMPDLIEDWWPEGLAAGSLQFWTGRPEHEINADLRRLVRAAIVDPATKTLVRIDWAAS